MAATGFLVFYRFKTMSKEEAERAKDNWHSLKNGLPAGIELVGEYTHAWGTEFKDSIRWYVEQTHTIVARRR